LAEDDDALLDATIAENKRKEAADKGEKEAQMVAEMEEQMKAMRAGLSGLSREQIVEKLNEIPSFAIMHETADGTKKFLPMMFRESAEATSVESCAFFSDPYEAKHAMQQASGLHAELKLVLGVMPLGKAYALTQEWAEAQAPPRGKGKKVLFTLRGAPSATRETRDILKVQLQKAGLSTEQCFPVFLCEELQSDAVLPVFFTREGVHSTWKLLGKDGPPPDKITVTDLRILVGEMQKGFKETGCNWSIVRFLGSENGYNGAKEGQRQDEARAAEATAAASADPTDEPPPLL